MLLAVDPGLRASGVALFDDSGLLLAADHPKGSASTARADAWNEMARAVLRWARPHTFAQADGVDRLAIELPQVYDRAHQKGDQGDLIQLAATVGAICSVFAGAVTKVYLPFEWKKTIPKEIQHPRAMKRLSAAELAVIPKMAASRAHNMMDAVALGLTHLGRLG